MAREAGARRVYFASAAPPVRYPNVYGIDMPAVEELVAHNRDDTEVCAEIGADRLIYQKLTDLEVAVRQGNPSLNLFESSCFDGHYVTGDIDGAYLRALEEERSDAAKSTQQRTEEDVVGLHNAS
jgi:amidophosphoribosyltransferase